jgi:hypothetical protein
MGMSEPTDAAEPDPEPGAEFASPADRLRALEDRVRKLETAVAERPTPASEDAVADRVIAKLSALAGKPHDLPESDRVLVLDSAPRPLVNPEPPLPPRGAVLHPPDPTDPARRTWFLTQLAAEMRLSFRMYFDPRYRISRLTQFALPGIGLLLIFNYFLFSQWMSIPFLSPIAERLLAIFLVIVGYKLLVRELARYREVLEYLSKFGR